MKTYIVIGLGRFGTAVATKLYELGNEVLAIDAKEENIQRIANHVTHAVVGDARDEAVLKALGVRNFECAIVAIGEDLAASILVTLTLKEIGVPAVICKASSEAYKRALEKVGADRVVIPEREMATKLAQNLSCSNILDFIELSDEYGIAEVSSPANWSGKTIRELNVRARFGVTVLGLKVEGRMHILSDVDEAIAPETALIVLGSNEQIARLQRL